MNPMLFIIFVVFIYFDVLLFRKQDKTLVKDIFQPSHWIWKVLTIESIVILVGTRTFQELALFWMICPLPIYLVRRWRFKKAIKALKGEPAEENQLILALDAFDVLVCWFLSMVAVMFSLDLLYRSFPVLESRLGDLIVLAIFSSFFMVALIHRVSKRYSQWNFRKLIALEIPQGPFWRVWA
ncbi:MAG: hypothetical protein NUV91_03805, partial [Candidatus Omnitrophica bacterium]|nr:hypothetical protein [Candidatus Omnitrophota bacterium]